MGEGSEPEALPGGEAVMRPSPKGVFGGKYHPKLAHRDPEAMLAFPRTSDLMADRSEMQPDTPVKTAGMGEARE